MFARLGSWCFRKRRRVAVLWVARRPRRRRHLQRASAGTSVRTSNRPASRAPAASTSSRTSSTTRSAPAPRARSCSAPSRASTILRSRSPWTQLFAMVQTIADDPDVDVASDPAFAHLDDDARQVLEDADLGTWEGITIASPYDDPTGRQISSQGDERRPDRLRQPRDPRRRLGGGAARSVARWSRSCPTVDGAPGRARRRGPRRVRGALHRGARPGVRHRDPRAGVRLGARDGPPRRRGAGRHLRRLGDRHDPVEPARHARLRAVPRRHDRPRRGHRLRAVHRHPVPGEPPPRAHARGGDLHRDRHRRAAPWPSRASPSSCRSSAWS